MFLPTTDLFQRTPLPVKGVAVGLLCGLVAWVVSDCFQTPALEGILTQQLTEHLQEEAAQHRILFDRYINQHGRAIKLLAAYQPLVWWLQHRVANQPVQEIRHYRKKRPPWFPPISAWRGLIDPSYLLLRDTEGRLREVYHVEDRDLPAAFLSLDGLSMMRSQNQAYLTLLDGRPYLLASAPVTDARDQIWGELVLITLLDSRFLSKLSYGTLPSGALLALVEGADRRVIASSAPTRLVVGTSLDDLRRDYVVTGKPFFDYGASDLRLQLATFIPRTDVAALNEGVLVLERQQRIIIAVIFITTFTLAIFLLSQRINHILWGITTFSQRALGSRQSLPKGGDRLAHLDKRSKLLTEEVLAAREAMHLRHEMEQKAKEFQVLEAVTQEMEVGIVVLGNRNQSPVLNQRMADFETQYGKEWYLEQHGEVKLLDRQQGSHMLRLTRLSLFEIGDVVLVQDITAPKRAEQILRESEEQFRSITQSANDAIISIDSAGNVVSWNKAAEKTFGYPGSEVLGTSLTRLMPQEYRGAHTTGMRRVSIGEASRIHVNTRELEGLRRDGTVFPIELSLSTWTMQGARYFTGIVRDITERRERDAQLLQAQKMEVVGRFTGGIAHDFNNLLTVILGSLEVLDKELGGKADAETRELVDDALYAARGGAGLTRSLLAFARKQPLQPQRVDLKGLLDELDRFLRRTLRTDIGLRVRRAQDASAVLADPVQLENALLNLVINARDAMPEGGTLTIETSRQPIGPHEATGYTALAPGNHVVVTVADTGIGMSSEDATRAVEPFYTTKEDGKGSGLGLSTVYAFAKQSGGDLLLKSEPGKGTAVSILLPEAAPTLQKAGVEETPGDLPGGTETVLVVEDEPRIRKFTRRSLAALGYRVLEAENGEAAMDILGAVTGLGLLFTDVVMSGKISGLELASQAIRTRPGLRVLITTGAGRQIHDAITEGEKTRFPLLEKPYTRDQLAKTVRAVLEHV